MLELTFKKTTALRAPRVGGHVEYKGYVARVEFEPEAGILFGRVEGVRDVITFEGASVVEVVKAFHDSVDDYLEMCTERGEQPDKPYSGKFVVRVDPELHRDFALAAAREGKSLNNLAMEALANWLENLSQPKKDLKLTRANASVSEGRSRGYDVRAFPALTEVRQVANAPGSPAPRISQDTPTSHTPESITPGARQLTGREIQ